MLKRIRPREGFHRDNFGVTIAFLLPGFALFWGLSYSFPDISALLGRAQTLPDLSVGRLLYIVMASLTLGMVIGAVRWAVVDQFLYCVTRLHKAQGDYGELAKDGKFKAFTGFVDNHYRYYQYYSNTLTAVLAGFIVYAVKVNPHLPWSICASGLMLAFILLLAARNALKHYNERVEQLLKRGDAI